MSRFLSLALTILSFIAARIRWNTLRGARLRRYQERCARRIVAYAAARSPFYRRHWGGHDLHRWRALPTVDKQLMMDNFDGFNTAGLRRDEAMEVALHAERSRDFTPTLGGYTVGLSSGTSGHRGLFVAGAGEQALWAGTILSRTLHTLKPRKLRVAFFLRSNSNLYEKVGGLLIKFRFFDLMMPLEEAVERLNAFMPHIVVGPPSLLGFLADERVRGQLRAAPERLVSVAEVLEPQDAQRLTEAFGAPVQQIYQCTEGLLAVSCRLGSLHIQEDLAVMQLQPLGGGRYTPIVTDLWRTTQPIIRYRLNDVLRLSRAGCKCGSSFRVIEAIEGRCDDIVYFSREDGSTRAFFPDTIRRMVLLASEEIEDYLALQERPGHLRLHLALRQGTEFGAAAREVAASVEETVRAYGCVPPSLEFVPGIPERPTGAKRRRVIRA